MLASAQASKKLSALRDVSTARIPNNNYGVLTTGFSGSTLILITLIISLIFLVTFSISYYNNNGFLIHRAKAMEFNSITVGFKAAINTVGKPEIFGNAIHKGDSISGSYTYNLAPDTSPSNPVSGLYVKELPVCTCFIRTK